MLPKLLAAMAALAAAAAAALPPIEIVGNKFYYSNNGLQFLLRGVAYQLNPNNSTANFVDPLADADTCKRDIPYLQQLQTNAIRVYALNVTLDHTACMEMLQDAGIYVIADLLEPNLLINRALPLWDLDLYNRYTGVVDLFHNYTNVLGFFAGNEVLNEATNTGALAYVKAAIRDTKAYIKAQKYRAIPVGYLANDDTDIRVPLADYFACGGADDDARADFFGINMYEWCGQLLFEELGYATITKQYANLTIPAFFSEYGCNKVQPRTFEEVGTIYGLQMLGVWLGGIVYQYFEETNNFGLVLVAGDTVLTLVDFANLKLQLALVLPLTTSVAATTLGAVPAALAAAFLCPAEYVDWAALTNLPPTPDEQICGCMQQSLQCVVLPSVLQKDYSDLYAYVCDHVLCDGVNGNGTTGEYGAYSGCNATEKINFVLNLYYLEAGGGDSNCDFLGSATLQLAATASLCAAYLLLAGASGLGSLEGSVVATLHNLATATAAAASVTASAKSSSGTKLSLSATSKLSSKSSGAVRRASVGAWAQGAAVVGAAAFGAIVLFV